MLSHKSLPTMFSKTELFPLDWLPTTTIWGRSMGFCTPTVVKTSWSLLTSLEELLARRRNVMNAQGHGRNEARV